MNNDNPVSRPGNASPARNRSFGAEAQRETESVFRRAGGESLDDYLHNINLYLNDLNSRLDVLERGGPERTDAPEAGVPFAVPSEADIPFTVPPEQAADFYEADGYGGAAENAPLPEEYDSAAYAPETPPYGISFAGELYTEPAAPEGFAGSNWQAAVPNPELYPDLDDPAVTGAGRRKKKKKEHRKAERAPRLTGGGKSRFSFVTTVCNLILYGGWNVLYFVCLSVRSAMFTGTQTEMAAQGVANYSVTISSPLFTVLKILVYLMPVVLLLWMKGVLSADKKQLPQLDKRLLIAAFAVDLLAGFVVIFDVLAAGLLFG